MDALKHCFKASVKHWFIHELRATADNQRMLDRETLAVRIRQAMDEHKPEPLTLNDLATAFDVTPQAVHGWRTKGRIAKGKLLQLAQLTGKPARFFLGGVIDASLEQQAFTLAEDWLSLTNPAHRDDVRDLLDKYLDIMERFPELAGTPAQARVAKPAPAKRESDK